MLKAFFQTFGCRVNQYETEVLREKILAGGLSKETEAFENADLCVINTCTVTKEADKDALRLLRRISRRNPAARLVVTGCLASRSPKEILEAAPAATVVGNDAKEHIPALLGCAPAPAFAGVTGLAGRTRAFVKIQDGCNMHCAYCIIPAIRPALSCKPIGELETEIRGLVERGVRELVLCGVRLGRYLVRDERGRRVDFPGMLDLLLDLPGDFRLRLSSLEITDLTDRLVDVLVRREGKLCPSFHVPLQSGSDPVLRRMERWYTAGFFARRVAALRERWPDAGVFTDVMVGFPGETRALYDESRRFIAELGFSGLHVFRYSKRPGTPAARWKDHVDEDELVDRARDMRELDGRLRADFAKRAVGSRRRVLVEEGGAHPEGLSEHFLRVRFDRPPGDGLVWADVVATNGPLALAQKA